MLRARLSLCALEGRENPSGPGLIDPIGVPATPPTEPPPAPTTPVVTSPVPGPNDPIVQINPITGQPLVP